MTIDIWQLLLGKTWLGIGVRSLLLLYFTVHLVAFFFADKFIFYPPSPPYQDSPAIIKLKTRNQNYISALYRPNPIASFTILYSHGNGSDLSTSRDVLETIQQAGFAVFAYDYQGYGTSQGSPSEHNTYNDIEAAYQYLTQSLQIPADRIILYGFSVGSGPSIDLATRHPVAGLILEGAFTSILRVVVDFPIWLFSPFHNLDKLQSITVPLLIMHGTADQVIPLRHGKTLYQQANPPKTFVPIADADHNNLMDVAGQRYIDALQTFARSLKPAAHGKTSD